MCSILVFEQRCNHLLHWIVQAVIKMDLIPDWTTALPAAECPIMRSFGRKFCVHVPLRTNMPLPRREAAKQYEIVNVCETIFVRVRSNTEPTSTSGTGQCSAMQGCRRGNKKSYCLSQPVPWLVGDKSYFTPRISSNVLEERRPGSVSACAE